MNSVTEEIYDEMFKNKQVMDHGTMYHLGDDMKMFVPKGYSPETPNTPFYQMCNQIPTLPGTHMLIPNTVIDEVKETHNITPIFNHATYLGIATSYNYIILSSLKYDLTSFYVKLSDIGTLLPNGWYRIHTPYHFFGLSFNGLVNVSTAGQLTMTKSDYLPTNQFATFYSEVHVKSDDEYITCYYASPKVLGIIDPNSLYTCGRLGFMSGACSLRA